MKISSENSQETQEYVGSGETRTLPWCLSATVRLTESRKGQDVYVAACIAVTTVLSF